VAQGRAATASWSLAVPAGCRTPGARPLAALSGDLTDGGTHQLVRTALLGLLQAGWSDEQAARAVESSPGLSWRVGTEQRRGWGWLLARARDARRWADDHPAALRHPDLLGELAGARQLVAGWVPEPELAQRLREQGQLPQLGKLRAVGVALLELAQQLGRVEHLSVGLRELGERAGVHRDTAGKALRVWRGAGLVVQVEPSRWQDGVQLAATYRLDLSALTSGLTDGPADELLVTPDAAATVAHDAWRHGGLGHGAWQVWQVLRDDQLTRVDELAAALGSSARTVERYLTRLEPHRLVTRVGDGWRRCTVDAAEQLLAEAARHEGTQGRGELQRERHAAERVERAEQQQRYRAWLRQQHQLREREHYLPENLPEPPEGDELTVHELVGALREHAAEQAHERAPAYGWADPDEVPLRELVGQLAAFGDELRRQLEPTQRAVQAWADGAARSVAAVARWADEHADELAAARGELEGAP